MQCLEARGTTELAPQDGPGLALHEDAPLERQPGRQLGELLVRSVGRGGGCAEALRDVAVGVAGVAVRAPEGAADVRIDRPEAHARGRRTVQQAPRIGAEVADVLLLPEQRGEAGSRVILIEHCVLHGVSKARVPDGATAYRTNPETASRRPGHAMARAMEWEGWVHERRGRREGTQ